jgi:hypothetical protein
MNWSHREKRRSPTAVIVSHTSRFRSKAASVGGLFHSAHDCGKESCGSGPLDATNAVLIDRLEFGRLRILRVATERHLAINIPTRKTAPTALEVPNWGRWRSDRSRRKQSAALLSVPVCDLGSSAGSPPPNTNCRRARNVGILTKYETNETRKTLRPIRRTSRSGCIDPPEGFIRG